MVGSTLCRFDYIRTLYSGFSFVNYKRLNHLLGMNISSYKRFHWSFRLTWIVYSLPFGQIKLWLLFPLSSNLRFHSIFKAKKCTVNSTICQQHNNKMVPSWYSGSHWWGTLSSEKTLLCLYWSLQGQNRGPYTMILYTEEVLRTSFM